MANTKVTGDLIASGTITAANLVSGTLDTLLDNYLTTNTYATQGYVTNSLATKLNLSGGTLTGGLHINTTSLPQLLIQNVDGGTNAERIAIEVTSGDIFKIRSLNDNNTTRTDNIITANIINGNVGIGTISTAEKLEVAGTIKSNANEGKLILNSTAVNGKQYEFISIDTGNFGLYDGTSYRLWVNGNGNIGVRSTNPGSEISSNATVLQIDDSNVASLALNNSNSGKYEVAVTGLGLDIRKDGSNKMLVDTSGNVGINTTSPAAKLEIYGTGNTLRLDSAANQSKTILFRNVGTATAEIKTDGNLKLWAEDAGRNIYFDTSGGTKMTILSSGNVGIGTTDPKTKLQVNGPIGMRDGSGEPKNARFVKTGTSSVSFNISVGAVGAWRAGHAFLKVSGAQNGLQEHHSAWYHLKLVHYYLSGVTQSGTSNPALIKDSGGDTGSYTLSVTSTGSSNPQVITITISDANGSTNSMIADIDATFFEGIQSIS